MSNPGVLAVLLSRNLSYVAVCSAAFVTRVAYVKEHVGSIMVTCAWEGKPVSALNEFFYIELVLYNTGLCPHGSEVVHYNVGVPTTSQLSWLPLSSRSTACL